MLMKVPVVRYVDELHQWHAPARLIERRTVPGRFTLLGFRILTSPQFSRVDPVLMTKALLRQKMFLDSFGSLLSRNSDAAVELRIVKGAGRKTVELFLVFRVFNPADERDPHALASVGNILPSDYEYAALSAADDQHADGSLHLSLRLPDDAQVISLRKQLSWLPVGNVASPSGLNRLLPLLDVAEITGDGQAKLAEHAHLVPGLDYLTWNDNNWLTLWSILQDSEAAACVRISLASLPLFPYERAYANQAMLFILNTYGHYARSNYEACVKSLGKYARPASLFSYQMQVASSDETTLSSVAHALASEVSYGATSRLACFAVPPKEMSATRADWKLCRHTYPDELPDLAGVAVPPQTESFLLRAPFIVDESEAATLFRLPVAGAEGLPGIHTRPPKPFYQPNLPPAPSNVPAATAETAKRAREVVLLAEEAHEARTGVGLRLGHVIINNRARHYHRVGVDDLTRHALIVGATGSGKTNSTLNLLNQLAARNIPFLVVEPVKGEYRRHFQSNPAVFTYDLSSPWVTTGAKQGRCYPRFLRFNPLAVPPGISVAQHISHIKSCICAAFPMYGAMPIVLELALRNLYVEQQRMLFFDRGGSPSQRAPSLTGLQQQLMKYIDNPQNVPHKETADALRDVFLRRFTYLLSSVVGYVCTPEKWARTTGEPDDIRTKVRDENGRPHYYNPLEVILSKPAVVDLEALADDDEKALLMAFLFTLLYEHRIAAGADGSLKHVTVIEEAHRLLSSINLSPHINSEGGNQADDSKTKALRLFMDMLAEIRAYGEGIIIVEQIPTKLISDVIKNTNLKIMHRITAQDDREYLGASMNFDEQQKQFVTNLRRGEAIAFEENLDHPVLLRVDPRKS